MTNEKGQVVCAVIKLKNRIDGHHASMTEDFQTLRDVVIGKRREEKNRKMDSRENSNYLYPHKSLNGETVPSNILVG